ncbi:L,D-transpeptidase family protein [Methylobacterium durans]|uniref:L,D-transpeptidase family protein n=1 Tax=Methylobacterium durans TaxID=2202825 RepID=UPI002AFF99EF|nr:L,D-transpeptidase family protein [Methylobacterium durans]MEA1832777.1 L,D-transpeptidase family protein [Methylobacterium durans]
MGLSRSATLALAVLAAAAPQLRPAHAEVQPEAARPAEIAPEPAATPDPVRTDALTERPDPGEPKAEATTAGPPEAGDGAADAKPEPASPAGVAEAPAAAPAAPPPPADPQEAAVAARLADPAPLLSRLTTKEREAIQAFYALGAFKPVWIADRAFTPAAKAVAARLARAAEDGLDPAAYPVPVLGVLTRPETEAEIAEADLKLSASVALYARDARGGRLNPSALSRLITPTLDLPAPDAVLGLIATAGDAAGDRLQRYNPDSAGYRALKARLAAIRERTPAGTSAALPSGPVLKVGMRDARVPLIRARFGLAARRAGTLDAGPGEAEDYDSGVAAAVAAFQKRHGLPASGDLTPQTVAALGGPEAKPVRNEGEAELLVNMERWRWLPALGRDYVMVNIPEFRLRVFRDGLLKDETRVIVGKTESPTPIFSGMMEYAVVNPSWNVPPSILKNEFLPGLARDSNYAARRGYQVVRRGNTISVRQPPGERNALGFIKFLFPNNHAVYLHDTPNRSLFSASFRAMSHGCVRVDDPFRFADSVLPAAWTSERLTKLIGKGERTIRLDEKLPVHLAYFTAYLDDAGQFRTLPDLYGVDARMRAALGLPGGAALVAKAPPEPKRRAAEMPKPKPQAVAQQAVPHAPRLPRRTARAAEAPPADFGEPGLWTPRPAPVSRGWW